MSFSLLGSNYNPLVVKCFEFDLSASVLHNEIRSWYQKWFFMATLQLPADISRLLMNGHIGEDASSSFVKPLAYQRRAM
jgi:hypothetical protein